MRYGTIHFALTSGKMQAQGASLTPAQQGQLVDYIVGRQVVDETWIERMRCTRAGETPAGWHRMRRPNRLRRWLRVSALPLTTTGISRPGRPD